MPSKISVVDATEQHIEDFLSRPIRQSDVDEWVILSGGRRVGDILRSHALGGVARAALLGEQCVCLWGVHSNIGWLIASEYAERNCARSLHRLWKRELSVLGGDAIIAITLGQTPEQDKWHATLGFSVEARVVFEPGGHLGTIYGREP